MGSLSTLLVLVVLFCFLVVPSLSFGNLFGGVKNTSNSGGTDNLIICTVRYTVHYSRVYDTILVDKVSPGLLRVSLMMSVQCHPTTANNCHQSGSSGYEGGGGQSCQTHTEKKCSSKMETVTNLLFPLYIL